MENTTMTTTTEQRGFTGVYDAAGHRADVIQLLQGGKMSAEIYMTTENQRKLSDAEVRRIRALVDASGGWHGIYSELARRFEVSNMTIARLVRGERYKDVA